MTLYDGFIESILRDIMGPEEELEADEREEWDLGMEYGRLIAETKVIPFLAKCKSETQEDKEFAALMSQIRLAWYLTPAVRGYVEGLQQPRKVRA